MADCDIVIGDQDVRSVDIAPAVPPLAIAIFKKLVAQWHVFLFFGDTEIKVEQLQARPVLPEP